MEIRGNRPVPVYDFAKTAVSMFFLTFTALGVVGLLPSDIQLVLNANPLIAPSTLAGFFGNSGQTTLADVYSGVYSGAENASQIAPILYTLQGEKEYPVRVIIPALNKSVPVENPETTDPSVLDADLSLGAVRYPTSGALNDGSNVFLFGHSSYLPLIHNQAYKTFDGLQNLQKGDVIEIDGSLNAYIYTVTSVQLLKDSDALVNVTGEDHELILSTCDVFGEKEDRFIVTAAFSRSYPLSQSNQ